MSEYVISREQSREIDRIAVEVYGLPSIVLMENAGRGVAEYLLQLGIHGPVVICVGKGNNGGDGLVIARHLENSGITVRVLLCCSPEELKGDAAVNYQVLNTAGTPLEVLGEHSDDAAWDRCLADADWIVDALLGTGAKGEVREPMRTIIERINCAKGNRLSVDVPSGLDCDSGVPMGSCIHAEHTATFIARKQGFDAPGAHRWTGDIRVIDIGVPRRLLSDLFFHSGK